MPKRKHKGTNKRKANATIFSLIGVAFIVFAILLANRSGGTAEGDPVVINNTAVAPVPALRADMAARGETLYMEHCAECHGVDLKGSPTWKEALADGSYPPPPQDDSGHTWHHADSLLVDLIQNGGDPKFNSTMPAFGDTLSEEEILSILEFFKSNWGQEAREFQWWASVRPE